MIPAGQFTPREPLRTLRFGTRWVIWTLRPAGIAFLLAVEAVTLLASVVVVGHTSGDLAAWARLGLLVVLSVIYAEVTDRVERMWVWLHTERGAWIGQSSILLFAGVLLLPTWAALVQCLLMYAHIGIRNKRYSTAPAHRWVWTGTTVLLATLASSYTFHALGGGLEHVDVVDLLAMVVGALIYSGVNLTVLLVGMYLALRPPTVRELLPARSEVSYESAKLLLAVVAAALLEHTPLLAPVVLLFAALLHRSTLVGELRAMASTDAKTGLLTYRAWSEQANGSLTRCQDAGRPAALVLLDLDHFKQLNDTYGHAEGDRALAAIGAILAEEVRAQDCVGRYGGEEFVIFLPGVGEERAVEIAHRLRDRIAGTTGGAAVTGSFGVAALAPELGTLEQLIDDADTAMYRAKDRGRNTVCAASAA
ncbi:GGDEF domain-containing protein [uncultured Jatrophihabitans sp.]|uniref:GGDEF domain-containing protein n=1 Tax=uncultured Jatrophihabitans sp. TaxID=1610747 RepID=UPI0035CB605D